MGRGHVDTLPWAERPDCSFCRKVRRGLMSVANGAFGKSAQGAFIQSAEGSARTDGAAAPPGANMFGNPAWPWTETQVQTINKGVDVVVLNPWNLNLSGSADEILAFDAALGVPGTQFYAAYIGFSNAQKTAAVSTLSSTTYRVIFPASPGYSISADENISPFVPEEINDSGGPLQCFDPGAGVYFFTITNV